MVIDRLPTMDRKHFLFAGVVAALLLLPLAGWAESVTKPLLIPGKQSLFQRVLAMPNASMSDQPGAAANQPVIPFTAFYVYARQDHGGSEWLQLGDNRHGSIRGWLPAHETLEWNQGLTAVFTDPSGHERALLFRDAKTLRGLADRYDLATYERYYEQAESGETVADSPVVAIQPAGYVDIQKDFYLVPIRRHEDVFLGTEQARMLQVTSVPLRESRKETARKAGAKPAAAAPPVSGGPAAIEPVAAPDPTPPLEPFRSGLVFVMDTTLSMEPYIQRTREAVRKIYDYIQRADIPGEASFGLVAFRDDPQTVPKLGYRVKTYANLEQGRTEEGFFADVAKVAAARVSSNDFIEDPYAGIKQAIEGMDWTPFDARYIVLVTDAGPREPGDPKSGTGLSAEALAQLAQDRGIAILVLHLLTPATMADHAADAEPYRRLSRYPGIGSLYYGVETGDVEKFGEVLDTLAAQITEQISLAAASKDTPTPAPAPAAEPVIAAPPEPPPFPEPAPDDVQLAELQAKVARLGYALRMRYLRKHEDDQIPTVFDAWVLDRDFRAPDRPAVEVRVLLTRDQLSDLHDVLTQVLDTAEEGLISPQGFLNDLKSLAATVSRDPELLGVTTAATAGEGANLADLGFMREYIEDLPYTGAVMNLSLEDWENWSAKDQVAFLHQLEDKISYYRVLHDHTDLWVSLDGGPVSGDSVFAVPLDMLP